MSIPSRVGLLICNDLMFLSKVTGIANSLGYKVEAVGMPQGLIKAAVGGYALIIVDLTINIKIADLIGALGSNPPPVIAFGPHVDIARLDEARQAGCAEVLPRSAFNINLPEILTSYLAEPTT